MEDLDIVFDPLPPDALSRFVTESLASHNIAATGLSAWYPVGFFLKNARGEWLGGLLGNIWGGWLHVTHLWVDIGRARGHGNGTRLLQAAENYAIERGCFAATLETHSFEARPFYEKRGYEVFATLEDYPPGHSKFFLRKQLTRSPARPGAAAARFLVRAGGRSRPRAAPRDLVQEHRRIRCGAAPRVSRRLRSGRRRGARTRGRASAEGALALVLLLDQVPRNIFRDTPRAYATDPAARAVADRAIERGFDQLVPPIWRRFFYMPFHHSEDLADQRRSVALVRRPAARSRPRRFLAPLRAPLYRGHRALRPLSAPQRNPRPGVHPRRDRVSRQQSARSESRRIVWADDARKGTRMDHTPSPVSLAAALALPRTPGRSAEVFVDGDLEVKALRSTHQRARRFRMSATSSISWPPALPVTG